MKKCLVTKTYQESGGPIGSGAKGAEIADEMYTWDFLEFVDVSGSFVGGKLDLGRFRMSTWRQFYFLMYKVPFDTRFLELRSLLLYRP